MNLDEAKLALMERHRSNGEHDCGAETMEMPCKSSIGKKGHRRHCSREPGHEGPHRDAVHCWAFETFTEDDVVVYAPRNLAGCDTCQQSWPCPERRFLNRLFEEAKS